MPPDHLLMSQMSAKLGQDRLLIQGAGGNVSWKENDTLWIKGSGTWLANALLEDIFVPVDLKHLRNALSKQFFDIKPIIIGEHRLKPSIETFLHSLMPHRIVVHLHAIHALSYLVIQNCQKLVETICQQHAINANYLDYFKPGPDLAHAIYESLNKNSTANVILLKNHGIVIGANSIAEIYTALESINNAFIPQNTFSKTLRSIPRSSPLSNYTPFDDVEVQALALDADLFGRLCHDWALFPDHVVFLGAQANIYQSWEHFGKHRGENPELIFIQNSGVYVGSGFNKTKSVQLRCYFDVISRVNPKTKLDSLSKSAISDLLNWDAELIRQQMAGH